jgi:hypothetical protein
MSANENPVPRANAENRADSKLLTGMPDSTKAAALASPARAGPIDFAEINRAALAAFPAVLNRLLPRGKAVGREIVALNPRRADQNLGSFKVNRFNGRWCDFATGDKGGDVVSLVAFLEGVSQGEAARRLAHMLGLEIGGRRHG